MVTAAPDHHLHERLSHCVAARPGLRGHDTAQRLTVCVVVSRGQAGVEMAFHNWLHAPGSAEGTSELSKAQLREKCVVAHIRTCSLSGKALDTGNNLL
jgi:hypothetical protein